MGESAFTLLEVMMVTLISSFVFSGVLTAYIFLGRGLARQVNEQGLESRSRLALYWLNQDVSTASSIAAENPGATTSGNIFTVSIPGAANSVTYSTNWSGGVGSGILNRVSGSTTTKLLSNLSSISFGYYDINGNAVSVPTSNSTTQINIKQVYMAFTTTAGTKSTGAQSNLTVVSPRVIMKNKVLLADPNEP